MTSFNQQLIRLLQSAQIARGEGHTVMLYAKQFNNLQASLIACMDSEAKQLALGQKFLYLPAFSGEDRLLFADITYTVKQFENVVDVYGYEKAPDGATRQVTLATFKARYLQNEYGNYGALFNDLVNDLKSLFPNVDISIPLQSLGKSAHIEIGKIDQFYSAGIVVVPEINELVIANNKSLVIKYAKINKNCLGVITDGYSFIVLKEQNKTGFLEENTMDYAHFVGYLVSYLRFVF